MSHGNEPAIAVADLTVRHGRDVILRNVSFTVPCGSTVALLGRNGAGKTSLVRCLLGQHRPARGTVHLLGGEVWAGRAKLMERVGVVPEEPDAPPHMTAEALVGFSGALYRRWHAARVLGRLRRLEVPLDVPSGALSRGQKAQLSLALALGHEPELLVLDDPTLGLDAIARRDFFGEVIDEMAARSLTVFITSHDLPGIERIAQRVLIVHGGKVVLDDELETIKAAFRRLPDGSASLEDVFSAVVEAGATGGLGSWKGG
jgi:ABC-2 type transport system ATP-binding protein